MNIVKGLENHENSCYMNVTIQALANLKTLHEILLKELTPSSIFLQDLKVSVDVFKNGVTSLVKVFQEMQASRLNSIEKNDKMAMVKWWNLKYNEQNDPSEIMEKIFSSVTQFEELSKYVYLVFF